MTQAANLSALGSNVTTSGNLSSASTLSLQTNSTTAVTIDTSQNVGIGVTPFANAISKGLDLQGGAGIFGYSNASYLTNNAYYDGAWKYKATASANYIYLAADSSIQFKYAASGTTGNAITWSDSMRIDSSGYALIGYTSSNGAYKLQVNSQIFATSSTIATSDARYKTDVTPISGALDIVNSLNPVEFNWKEHPVHAFDTTNKTVGFLAQEVKEVLKNKPYVNSIIKKNDCVIEPEEKDEDGNIIKEAVIEEFLGIAEGNMIAILTKAIQEQQTIINDLKARIETLEGAK